MNNKIIIANWKMNGSFDDAEIWINQLNQKLASQNVDDLPKIILCPPSIMIDHIDGFLMNNELTEIENLHGNIDDLEEEEIEELINQLRLIKLGGQDCHHKENGAFTGDISAKMLKDCGANYVILGHSERRKYHLEADQLIADKISIAIKEGLSPILCIGEAKEQRDDKSYQDFIASQLKNSLPKDLKIDELIIAYEPIWSIGTGLIPTVKEIEEIADLIKKELANNQNIKKLKILYGGSVNSKNSGEILKTKNIDGLLVGGASLKADEFFEIILS